MNAQRLKEIKALHEMSEKYPEHKDVIDVELLRKGVPSLLAEVERLQKIEKSVTDALVEYANLREALLEIHKMRNEYGYDAKFKKIMEIARLALQEDDNA